MSARVSSGSKLHCCVPLCNGDRRYSPNLSFHSFPKDVKRKRAWIVNIRREPGKYFQVTRSTRVCGKHFRPEDIYESPSGRRLLHYNSVPSIFSWTKSVPERPLPKRVVTERSLPEKLSANDSITPNSQPSNQSSICANPTSLDHNYSKKKKKEHVPKEIRRENLIATSTRKQSP
ncbi:THAP domain-containing protein 2-like [Styela clava]